jgi:hypothetical protein
VTSDASSNSLSLLPLGIPTLIIADDPQLIAAARAAYAHWRVETPDSEARIELRLETGGASSDGVCLDIHVEGSRLQLNGRGVSASADAATGQARATVPPELAFDPAGFTDVIDTLLLFLLARSGRTPVHSSAFMHEGVAVLLAGRSGSGKSTLALAAAAKGLPILSDDMVFVQLEPEFAVWGFPRPIHVFPEDAPAGEHEERVRNNKLKAALPIGVPALRAARATLVLLERGDELAFGPVDPSQAVHELMQLDQGFDLLAGESRAAAEELASRGAWRLTLARSPVEAIDFLIARLPAALRNKAVDIAS